jgi:hypothetical protein
MRRLSLILLVCLLLPAGALARGSAAGDGSLDVRDAWARAIDIQGTGVIFGHIDQGTLTVVEYDPSGPTSPQVSGAPWKVVGNTVRYSGSDVRFLFPSGHYRLRLEGAGIDISAVGKGLFTAAGLGTPDDGTVTVNGVKTQQLSLATVVLAPFSGKGGKDKDKDKDSSPGKAASH